MKIVSIINYKGGVGKTSLTANLAGELAYREKRVLLIDLDPQTSLTFSFIAPDEWDQKFKDVKTIKTWYDSVAENNPISLENLTFTPQKVNSLPACNGQIDIISSHLGLINVDLELATELGGASLKQAKTNYLKVHRRLAQGLEEVDASKYDIVLIDCPPNFNIVTKTAIVASDYILIPAKPDYLSTLGIDYLIQSLETLVSDYNEYLDIDNSTNEEPISPQILGIIFTMVQFYNNQPISSLRPFIRQTKQLGRPVFSNMIRENKTLFSETPQYGIPVALGDYSNASHQRVVSEIEAFVDEFVSKLGL